MLEINRAPVAAGAQNATTIVDETVPQAVADIKQLIGNAGTALREVARRAGFLT